MIIDFHTHTFPDKSSEKIVNHLAHIGCIPPHTDGSVIGLFSSMKEADIDYSVNQYIKDIELIGKALKKGKHKGVASIKAYDKKTGDLVGEVAVDMLITSK